VCRDSVEIGEQRCAIDAGAAQRKLDGQTGPALVPIMLTMLKERALQREARNQ